MGGKRVNVRVVEVKRGLVEHGMYKENFSSGLATHHHYHAGLLLQEGDLLKPLGFPVCLQRGGEWLDRKSVV